MKYSEKNRNSFNKIFKEILEPKLFELDFYEVKFNSDWLTPMKLFYSNKYDVWFSANYDWRDFDLRFNIGDLLHIKDVFLNVLPECNYSVIYEMNNTQESINRKCLWKCSIINNMSKVSETLPDYISKFDKIYKKYLEYDKEYLKRISESVIKRLSIHDAKKYMIQ